MLATFPKPMIFAHRGSQRYAPENTLAAFKLAVEQGADAIELDVKLTADAQAVVIHDQTVDRTTNGHGRVYELSLGEIKELDAGSFFGLTFQGERIPTLDEVFEVVGRRIFINVELTNYESRNDELVPVVANIVKQHQLQQGVIFSSFLPDNLIKIKNLLPECPVALLTKTGALGIEARSDLYVSVSPEYIHPPLIDVDEKLMEIERIRHRKVNVWTVNKKVDMLRMVALGVHGIITDDPIRAMQVLGRK